MRLGKRHHKQHVCDVAMCPLILSFYSGSQIWTCHQKYGINMPLFCLTTVVLNLHCHHLVRTWNWMHRLLILQIFGYSRHISGSCRHLTLTIIVGGGGGHFLKPTAEVPHQYSIEHDTYTCSPQKLWQVFQNKNSLFYFSLKWEFI